MSQAKRVSAVVVKCYMKAKFHYAIQVCDLDSVMEFGLNCMTEKAELSQTIV